MITDKIDVKDSLSIMLIPAKKAEGKKNEPDTKSIPSLSSSETASGRDEEGSRKSSRQL